jgi:hypothetical protein
LPPNRTDGSEGWRQRKKLYPRVFVLLALAAAEFSFALFFEAGALFGLRRLPVPALMRQ